MYEVRGSMECPGSGLGQNLLVKIMWKSKLSAEGIFKDILKM